MRGAPQVSREILWRLRESRKSRGKCFGVCGSSRKSRGIYRDVCASRASLATFTETFAQAAQVSRHLPRRLRRLRWVPRHLLWRLRDFRRDLAALQGRVAGDVRLSGGRVRPGGLRITRATCRAYAGGIVFAGALCTDGNRVASDTFDPADAAIELPATLMIQRMRQSSCQRHLRSSGCGNRVASDTYDPAASAIELPAHLRPSGPGS